MNIKKLKEIKKIKDNLKQAKDTVLMTDLGQNNKYGASYSDNKKFIEKLPEGSKDAVLLKKFQDNKTALQFQNMTVKQIHERINGMFDQSEMEGMDS